MGYQRERLTFEQEVQMLDLLNPAQRKAYLEAVKQTRGLQTEKELRDALVLLWRSFR